MLRPAKRLSLVAQTVAILKEHIASSSAGDQLPSERELCAHLGVSRMTLRAALARLTDEGWIKGSKGKRHLIAAAGAKGNITRSKNVVILSPVALQAVDPRVLFWIDELRKPLNTGLQTRFSHATQLLLRSSRPCVEPFPRTRTPRSTSTTREPARAPSPCQTVARAAGARLLGSANLRASPASETRRWDGGERDVLRSR